MTSDDTNTDHESVGKESSVEVSLCKCTVHCININMKTWQHAIHCQWCYIIIIFKYYNSIFLCLQCSTYYNNSNSRICAPMYCPKKIIHTMQDEYCDPEGWSGTQCTEERYNSENCLKSCTSKSHNQCHPSSHDRDQPCSSKVLKFSVSSNWLLIYWYTRSLIQLFYNMCIYI